MATPLEPPELLPVQLDLLERGRQAYARGARRVLWQATCGAGKTWVAAEQTRRALALNRTVLHVVHRRRLVDQMAATLDRFGVRASQVMDGRFDWGARVRCASRDTLLAMLQDGRPLPRADLVVWDEAHVAAAGVQDWYLRHCPDAWWTGYTATPVGPDGRSLAPPYQDLVCMAPTSELLRIKRLCPVKVYDPKAVAGKRRRGEPVVPVGDPVAHWFKYARGLPTVVFAARVSESEDVVRRYIAAGVPAEHIDARTPDDERDRVYERSRTGQTLVVSNVGVMTEGVDLPWLACCQILRGCNSLVLWVQACGRVMRSFEGKSHGVVLDHAGAVYDFGPPDSDYAWSLADGASNERQNKLPRERKPVACPACGFLIVGKPTCPECGRVLPTKQRRSLMAGIANGDAVLTEFAAGQREAVHLGAMLRLWRRCVGVSAGRGRAMRDAAAMFRKTAGVPPWEAGLGVPLPQGAGWSVPAGDWLETQSGGEP